MSFIGVRNNVWKEPQFIFGIILVAAWLLFLFPVLATIPIYKASGTGLHPLDSAERISALFSTALGFVWGHYFGKSGATSAARDILEPNIKEQERQIKQFVEGI